MSMKLSERAMLVTLHIGAYSGMMHDKEVTEAVNADFKADAKKAGRYNKRLVASEFLQGVSGAHNNARKVHRILTLPWEDDGTRILTTQGYLAYQEKMKECRDKVEREVRSFVDGLPEYIKEAKVRLGDMFNADDYPDKDELMEKFSFDIEVKNLPEAGDFRAQIGDAQMKAVIKDIEKRSNARMEAAVDDVFIRIKDVVAHMSEKLREFQPADPSKGKKVEGRIRDTVVYNIHQLAELIPSLNLTGDKRLEDLRVAMLTDLVEHSPEILRADTKVRQATLSKADKLLKKVEGYLK